MRSFNPSGFVFAKTAFSYVIKPEHEDGHILISGGTGTQKTKSVVIPSLISWRQRVFTIDMKGELAKRTNFIRPTIKIFNPLDSSSYGYDPYYLLKTTKNQAQAAREIALAIVPSEFGVDPYFAEGAQNILTGAVLHFFNLGYSFIETLLAIQNTPREYLIDEIFSSDTDKARSCVKDYVGMDADTFSNIFSGLGNKIIPLVTDDDLIDCFSRSKNITPDDLEIGFDVYLCIPEEKLKEWQGLLTLITSQFMKHFFRRPDNDPSLPPILFLLDEFPSLGKFEDINHALATLRSKKVIICLVIQDPSQLDVVYGHNSTRVIMANCSYKAILGCTDPQSQEFYSKLIGTIDEVRTSQNKSYGGEDTAVVRSTGVSESTQENWIIKPADLAYLPKRNRVVLLSPNGYECLPKLHFSHKRFR